MKAALIFPKREPSDVCQLSYHESVVNPMKSQIFLGSVTRKSHGFPMDFLLAGGFSAANDSAASSSRGFVYGKMFTGTLPLNPISFPKQCGHTEGVLTVRDRGPVFDRGGHGGAPHFSCKFPHKMALLQCPCAFFPVNFHTKCAPGK